MQSYPLPFLFSPAPTHFISGSYLANFLARTIEVYSVHEERLLLNGQCGRERHLAHENKGFSIWKPISNLRKKSIHQHLFVLVLFHHPLNHIKATNALSAYERPNHDFGWMFFSLYNTFQMIFFARAPSHKLRFLR